MLTSFASARYRQARARTAAPGSLVLELHDAALAALGVASGSPQPRAALQRAHALVCELHATLEESASPALCAELCATYDFVLERITMAFVDDDASAARDIGALLRPLRDGWASAATRQRQRRAA